MGVLSPSPSGTAKPPGSGAFPFVQVPHFQAEGSQSKWGSAHEDLLIFVMARTSALMDTLLSAFWKRSAAVLDSPTFRMAPHTSRKSIRTVPLPQSLASQWLLGALKKLGIPENLEMGTGRPHHPPIPPGGVDKRSG